MCRTKQNKKLVRFLVLLPLYCWSVAVIFCRNVLTTCPYLPFCRNRTYLTLVVATRSAPFVAYRYRCSRSASQAPGATATRQRRRGASPFVTPPYHTDCRLHQHQASWGSESMKLFQGPSAAVHLKPQSGTTPQSNWYLVLSYASS